MANKRIMKCGNSVYAVGEENSDADREEKAQNRKSNCISRNTQRSFLGNKPY